MSGEIDWANLASQMKRLDPSSNAAGSEDARKALEQIIGAEVLRASVDHYLTSGPGSELARSVLWLLRPWSAMSYCYEIFRKSQDPDARWIAVELLRVVADRRALPWIPEFLADTDPRVQTWGIGVLDQLVLRTHRTRGSRGCPRCRGATSQPVHSRQSGSDSRGFPLSQGELSFGDAA